MAVLLTYASAPKWTDTSMFCRLSVEFDQNSVDIPIDTVHVHKLYNLVKLVHLEHSPLASINLHETTTISRRVQLQFGSGTIYNIK